MNAEFVGGPQDGARWRACGDRVVVPVRSTQYWVEEPKPHPTDTFRVEHYCLRRGLDGELLYVWERLL